MWRPPPRWAAGRGGPPYPRDCALIDGSATLRDQRAFIFTKNRPRSLLPSRASMTAVGYLYRTDRVSCRGSRTARGDGMRQRTWSARGRRAAVLVTLPAPPAWSGRAGLAGVSLRWEQCAKRRLERRRTGHSRCRMNVCRLLSGGGCGRQVLMVADVRPASLLAGRRLCRLPHRALPGTGGEYAGKSCGKFICAGQWHVGVYL